MEGGWPRHCTVPILLDLLLGAVKGDAMTRVLLLALALTAGCGVADEVAEAGVEAPEGTAPYLEALRATVDRSSALADSIEAVLRPLPLMRPGDVAALRQYLNTAQVARARELGVHVRDVAHIDSLAAAGTLVALEDSTRYWVLRYPGAQDYVVPHTRELLEELGRRFQDRLEGMGLPPYRLEITSVLRTSDQQARLRARNPNATAGTSSHEFGTTVDIAYSVYPPPLELPEALVPADAPDAVRPYLERVADVTLESVAARKSRELKMILGEVLREAQAEGIVMVIHEQLQPVYHITVAAPLAG
ncbi:MAG: DUF5715 family protein [Gemmatimonadota bacterium]